MKRKPIKAKTARRWLMRNQWGLARIKAGVSRRAAMKIIKPYLFILKKDIRTSQASRRVYVRFANF